MKLIKELNQINEAEAEAESYKDVDVVDIVKNFPNTAKKAISALWGQDRLTFKGLSILGAGGVYAQLNKAVTAFCSAKGYPGIAVSIDFGEYNDEVVHIDYNDTENPQSAGQEVYLGYSAEGDTLIVGYDASLDEETFNEEFEKEWKQVYGENFEYDDNPQQLAFNAGHARFNKLRPYVTFAIDVVNGKVVVDDQITDGVDGFYSKGHASLKREFSDLIDIRLD